MCLAEGTTDIGAGFQYSEWIIFQKKMPCLWLSTASGSLCFSWSGAALSAGACPLVLPFALLQLWSHKATFHFNCNLEEVTSIFLSLGGRESSTFSLLFIHGQITPPLNTAGKNPQSWKLIGHIERKRTKRRCFL